MNLANEKIQSPNLKTIYNIVDWIDFGFVFLTIFYYGRMISDFASGLPYGVELNHEIIVDLINTNPSAVGIMLLFASLALCTTFIFLTVKIRARQEIGAVRAVGRLVWNGIWIVFDLLFLVTILF
ncbi:MAG: hypothetical protein FWB93_00570 [Oscillospiraceae bacterium]|nr:hypothetical protein [Oscillospiraceae bacterium]